MTTLRILKVNIDKVASDEEGQQMPEEEGADKLDEYY